jgi:EmrB/QacA subfamily drug resistance transporter
MELQVMSARRRTAVLLICSMSLFMVGLDSTAVNVALPDIGAQLDAGVTWLQWSVSAYTLVMASLLLLAGSTADRLGRKRTLLTGLSLFTFASVLCSLAPTIELLVAARVLQGIGASMLNPVAMSIITNTFTDPRERAHAVGVWGAVFGASLALGPIVGGALVTGAGWQWIFLINVPLGLAAIVLVSRFVPESKALRPRRVDPVGQVLVIVLLASVTYGVIEGPSSGWTSAPIVAAFATAAAALLAVLRYEPRRRDPLIDLKFFRSTPFSASIALSVAAYASFGGFLFLNTLYLQNVRHLSPIEAGLTTVPIALMTVVASPISGRLVGRSGPRTPLAIAGVALAVAGWMLVDVGASTALGWILAAYVVFGIGIGFVNAPITNAAVSGMPRAQAGVAAALATTSRQFGQAIGVAVAGAVASASAAAAWWTLTALGGLVLALGLLATGARAKESARRTALELNPEALAA